MLDRVDGTTEESFKVFLAENFLASLECEVHHFIKFSQKMFSGDASALKFTPEVKPCLLKVPMEVRDLVDFLPRVMVSQLSTE